MKELTEKQENILTFIRDRIRESGYPPTVREIGEYFSITVKGAYDHVKAIEKKGYISTEHNKSRSIVVLDEELMEDINVARVPLIGSIAAGSPILADEHIDEYLSVPTQMLGKGIHFGLRVRGDSMVDAGIFDGDVAVIRQQETAQNGDIVAALIDDEATLKRFEKRRDGIYLMPENPAYSPIVADNVSVLGILRALLRSYR